MFQSYNTVILNATSANGTLDPLAQVEKVQAVQDDYTAAVGNNGTILRVLRVNDFKKANICNIFKNPYTAGIKSKAEITFDALTADAVYRLNLYIRLSGSNAAYFANDMVLKGKPFVYEFKGSSTASTNATNLENAIKAINKFYGIKWFTTSVSGAKLTIECLDTLQLVTKADIEILTDGAKGEVSTSDILTNAYYTKILSGNITANKPAFGTYEQMIKDIKLPTMENRAWMAVDEEELPVPGSHYNQYVIEYVVDRGLFGGAAVGQQVTSKTEHIFYADATFSTKLDAEIAKLGITLATPTVHGPNDTHTEGNAYTEVIPGDGVQD